MTEDVRVAVINCDHSFCRRGMLPAITGGMSNFLSAEDHHSQTERKGYHAETDNKNGFAQSSS